MPYTAGAVVFSLLTVAVSGLLHYYYVQRSYRLIPWGTHAFILISLFVCILPFPILVLDVDSALHWDPEHAPDSYYGDGSVTKSPSARDDSFAGGTVAPPTATIIPLKPEYEFMHAIWLVIFFGTQVMAWIILPIAQEYDGSGAFTTCQRIKESIKSNIKMYLVLGIVVGALFGYIVFLKGVKSFQDIFGLALAAANAFGLLLLVIFMSFGMVGLPKQLWRKADPQLLLRYYYYGATDLQEEFDIVKMDLAELKAQVIALDPLVNDEENKQRLMQLLDLIDETVKVVPVHHSAASREMTGESVTEGRDVNEQFLVDLSTKVRKTTKLATRLNFQWQSLQKQCVRLDAIASGQQEGSSSMSDGQVMYYTMFRKPLLRLLAVLSVIMSICVAWSELMLPFQHWTHKELSLAEILVKNPNTAFMGASIFLFYMAASAFWTTFQIKIFNIFQLVPRHSDAASLCFVCTFLTRLILPLCYNFLWISDLTKKKDGSNTHVVYSEMFGRMDVVAFLGDVFNSFLPVLIPILCILIELKVFDRILSSAGVDRNDPTDLKNPQVRERIQEGRQLIAQMVGRELTASTGAADVPVSPRSNSGRTTPQPAPVVVTGTGTTTKEGKPAPGQRYAEWKAKRAAEAGSK